MVRKPIVLLFVIMFFSTLVIAMPSDTSAWCTTNPSFKPGCLKFLANERYFEKSVLMEEERCRASLNFLCPLECGR